MGLKECCLRVCKALGLFRLNRVFTGKGLRILCYHGLMPDSLKGFRGDIFLTASTFERRMRYLAEAGFHVVALSRALAGLQRGDLPSLPVVITFDDGYASVLLEALAILQRHGFAATVYLNTEDCVDGRPVERLVTQYRDWAKARDDAVLKNRVLELMRPDEVRVAAHAGVDIQLHTHSHRFPIDREIALAEIAENRRVIREITGMEPEHFCYPYGTWDVRQWPWLAEQNVQSATTCDPGMNHAGTPMFALKRFVDGEAVSQLEFEAEMSGFTDPLRRLTRALRATLSTMKRLVTRRINHRGTEAQRNNTEKTKD